MTKVGKQSWRDLVLECLPRFDEEGHRPKQIYDRVLHEIECRQLKGTIAHETVRHILRVLVKEGRVARAGSECNFRYRRSATALSSQSDL